MNYVIKQLNKIKCKSEQVEIIYSQFQQYFVDNFQPINLNISLDYKSLFKLHEKEKKQSWMPVKKQWLRPRRPIPIP